jgi:hypothetical protein
MLYRIYAVPKDKGKEDTAFFMGRNGLNVYHEIIRNFESLCSTSRDTPFENLFCTIINVTFYEQCRDRLNL